jgi:hypothetical protein
MFHLANSITLTGIVVIGLVCLLASLFTKTCFKSGKREFVLTTRGPTWNFEFDPWLLLPGALVALTFITSASWPYQVDVNDDWIAYLSLPEKLLQTGGLDEPFSQRRVVSLCGQTILQAMLMIVGEPENCHILDRGLSALLLFGLLKEMTCRAESPAGFIRCLIVTIPIFISVPRINTASYQLGIALCIATVYAARIVQSHKSWTNNNIAVVAILLAALASLRSTFAIWGGATFIIFFTLQAILKKKEAQLNTMTLFKLGILTIILLLPLMISSYDSSKTPFFPLFNGNLNTDVSFAVSGKPFIDDFLHAIDLSLNPLISVLLLNLLAVFFLKNEDKFLAACFIFSSFLVYSLSVFKQSGAEFFDVYRYSYPILSCPLYWILAIGFSSYAKTDKNNPVYIFGICVALVLSGHLPSASYEKQAEVKQLFLPYDKQKFFEARQFKKFYDHLLSLTPTNSKIFAIVDAPYLIDYTRNIVHNADIPGGASISPGMPFGKGSDALLNYFRKNGYEYILAVDFDNAVLQYTRKLMQNNPKGEWYTRHGRKYGLDLMKNIDEISNGRLISLSGNTRLIDIRN